MDQLNLGISFSADAKTASLGRQPVVGNQQLAGAEQQDEAVGQEETDDEADAEPDFIDFLIEYVLMFY